MDVRGKLEGKLCNLEGTEDYEMTSEEKDEAILTGSQNRDS